LLHAGDNHPMEPLWNPAGYFLRPFASRQRQENFNEISVLPLASVRGTQPRGPKYKKDFWQAEVTKMIKLYGAPIEETDVPKIVEYLAATY